RTRADTGRWPATRPGEPGASPRHGRAATAEPGTAAVPQATAPEAPAVTVTAVRMLQVEEGLYALRIGEIAGRAHEIAGMAVPAAHVSAPFAESGNGVEIVASFPRRGPWVEKAGGTLILRSPIGGGYVVVTAYGDADQPAGELPLELRRLDGAGNLEAAAPALVGDSAAPGQPGSREVPTEILLHIERAGDRLF